MNERHHLVVWIASLERSDRLVGEKMYLGEKKLDCKIEFEFKPHHCTHCFTRFSPSLPLILSWIHFFCQLHLPLVPLVRGQTELWRVKNCHDLKHPRKLLSLLTNIAFVSLAQHISLINSTHSWPFSLMDRVVFRA